MGNSNWSSLLAHYGKNILYFSIAALVFGLIVAKEIYPLALYTAVLMIPYVLLLLLIRRIIFFKESHFLVVISIFSLIAKVFAVLFFENILLSNTGMPYLSYNDDYNYNMSATAIYMAWETRGFGFYDDVLFGTGFYSGYPNFSALAKYLFGDSYLVPRFMNVFFSVATVPFFYHTAKYLVSNSLNVRIVTVLLSFSPALITYSSLQLKDTILVFFVATMLYGTASYFFKGASYKNTLIVVLSMVALLFFRAAILLPYLVAFIATMILIRTSSVQKIRTVIWIFILFFLFYLGWEYLHNTGLLAMTGEEYFESRFLQRAEEDQLQGSNDLSKLGVIAIIMAPLLMFLSLFLPSPVYVQLDAYSTVINYHYLPIIGYYAILPMVIVGILYMLKRFRLYKLGVFLLLFMLLYKVGQAGSKSIFDSRQSLPAIYVAYFFICFFDLNDKDIIKIWGKYKYFVFSIMLILMFSVTYLRFSLRA